MLVSKRLKSLGYFRLLMLSLVVAVSGCGGGGSGSDSAPAPGSNPGVTANGFVEVVARTGPILGVRVGETASLDGSPSFSNSASPITYRWSLLSKPESSQVVLQNPTAQDPRLTPDVRGTYVAQLVVSAESVESKRAVQLLMATVPPEPNSFHQGLSSDCVNCHSTEIDDIPGKTGIHVATGNTCATCHTPFGFDIVTAVDHQEVFGYCSECHNGVLAIGKSEFHIETDAECDSCHNTEQFLEVSLDGSFDHSGITRSCVGCHNGSISIGKTPTPPHPDTSAECGSCHTTESFLNAFPDHTGPEVLGSRCDSCHGVSAIGQTAGHPMTNVDCGSCHSTATFSLGGVFNHRVVDANVQPCESCHNDSNSIGARAKSSAVPTHPATTSDCANCHNTQSFTGAFFDHTGIVDNCASCHGVTAVDKHLNHMPTNEDCSVCHSLGTFTTGTYDHLGVVNNCESCHDNVITLGKLINHIPTAADCSVCHDTTDFGAAIFDHVGIDTNDCASCHTGDISLGKPINHIPTNLDCSACHSTSDFSTFAGIVFSHVGIDNNNCATCHATGLAVAKDIDHIPAQPECSVCHDSTVMFGSTTFLTVTHPDIVSGCEGCHTDQFFPGNANLSKAADHLPVDQDCDVCHVNTSFAPSTFNHTGISGDCASCHSGNAGYAALGAIGKTPIPVHQNTTSDCSTCHNTTSFEGAFVDHTSPEVLGSRCDSCHNGTDATGKDAKVNHVATTEDCGVCHTAGGAFTPAIFDHTGIVNNCASCHNGTDATGKDAKINPPHIPTNEDCSVCHTPASFAAATFDHQGIVGNCASCHDGGTAVGKAGNHVPTNADCVECHVTTGFLPAVFEHAGIVDNCSSCHDAGFATGKHSAHLGTNEDCGVCHNTTAFIPATFDHSGIVNNCASCHGVTAVGKPSNHISTTLDCSSCHTTATFVGGIFDHQGITDNCMSCHDGSTAIGSEPQGPNDHFITNAECNTCHATAGWAPVDFVHSNASNYPGDHRVNPGCRECHTANNENLLYPSPQYSPFCAGCHERDFERKGDHIGGENGTVEQNKDCSSGGRGCHRVSDRKFD